eukprot:CAMPEP_0178473370 /NCGR_PEP_ID=MMETSP0696-20121128/2053_1 /TAXON_ID=265572 /ORGANISM="Extubocellulus spinifer, Strain CCMP396" /LENGTH=276 /DNA_ID=CAMNT_0020100593 /DNA_START=77 /DNA_END=904 /DNA_ORIENTATION=-
MPLQQQLEPRRRRAVALASFSLSMKSSLLLVMLVSFLTDAVCAFGTPPAAARSFMTQSSALKAATSSTTDDFDFSSKAGWDGFYVSRSHDATVDGKTTSSSSHDASLAPATTFEPFEWHASLPHSKVFESLPPSCIDGSVLLVGCGTSTMPIELYDLREGNTRVVCLDYSEPCVEQLKASWTEGRENMTFVCGDATRLKEVNFPQGYGKFDAIIDKGLIDALMCGESWDRDVERLLSSAAAVLKPSIGEYLLVSYKLTTSTKEFLEEVGDEIGLQW